MSIPAKHYIDEVRGMRGGTKVSYPYGGSDYPRIERVYAVPKGRVDDVPRSFSVSGADGDTLGAGDTLVIPADTHREIAGSYTILGTLTIIGTLTFGHSATLVQLEEIKRDQLNVEIYVRYDTLPGPSLPGRVMSDEAHGAIVNTARQILAVGASEPAFDFRTLSFTDSALDVNRIERSLITLLDAAFPTLHEIHVDEATGIKIAIAKQIVPAGTASTGPYQEIQALDKWRSISISSSLDVTSLPAERTWEAMIRHSFPDILTVTSAGGGATGGMFGFTTGGTVDLDFNYKLVQGYSGPCKAFLTEKYLTALQYALYTAPTVTKYHPQGARFFFYGTSGGSAKVWPFSVPISLHDAFTPGFGSVTAVGAPVPATDPVSWSSGDVIYVDVQPEKWRFGAWHILEIRAVAP